MTTGRTFVLVHGAGSDSWYWQLLTTELERRGHEVIAPEALRRGKPQSGTPFEKPWPLRAWPEVPTRIVACRDDRFFTVDFQRRVARERLSLDPYEIDGGHLVALSRPAAVADLLESFAAAPQEAQVPGFAGGAPVQP